MALGPEVWRLIREAQEASEEVDDFDLDREDPESAAEWKVLLARQDGALASLVAYIQEKA